jgi:hypothetical protein
VSNDIPQYDSRHIKNYTKKKKLYNIVLIPWSPKVKQERFDMVCPAWLKQSLKELADAKNVTLSEYVKDLLKSHVETAQKEKKDDCF